MKRGFKKTEPEIGIMSTTQGGSDKNQYLTRTGNINYADTILGIADEEEFHHRQITLLVIGSCWFLLLYIFILFIFSYIFTD